MPKYNVEIFPMEMTTQQLKKKIGNSKVSGSGFSSIDYVKLDDMLNEMMQRFPNTYRSKSHVLQVCLNEYRNT